MSSIVLTGDTSGTITVSAPAVAGTRTLTLPAATGTAILEDASGVLQMNSGYGSLASAYGCRAWVNFNGTSTVAIRDSANVSSVTDNGTGDYTINFAIAMPDANYSQSGFIQRDDAGTANTGFIRRSNSLSLHTINGTRIIVQNPNLDNVDPIVVAVAVFR